MITGKSTPTPFTIPAAQMTAGNSSLRVVDGRTGASREVGVGEEGQVKAGDFKALGLTLYDPGYFNTAVCTSRITFIDGEKGVLRYRGYPIEQLAEQSSFLEVAYLLIYGELPSATQLGRFTSTVLRHQANLHTEVIGHIHGFR
jgi:citrate synthase